jgi:hypothetical protein
MIVVEVVEFEMFVEFPSIVVVLTHLHRHNVLRARRYNDHRCRLLVVDYFSD